MTRAFVVLLLGLVARPAFAADSVVAPGVLRAAGADSVRTNIWLAQALLADLIREAAEVLPPGATVVLIPGDDHEADPLMEVAAYDVLDAAGHPVLLPDPEVEIGAGDGLPADAFELSWRLERVVLEYPRVGRFLGLWSRWVDRDLEATALLTVRDRGTGRLLLDRRVVKTYNDRIGNKSLDEVNSDLYAFTAAKPDEGGLRGILEEVVVIGALTSMVAVYFANSGS
jgi:hypothetical protein